MFVCFCFVLFCAVFFQRTKCLICSLLCCTFYMDLIRRLHRAHLLCFVIFLSENSPYVLDCYCCCFKTCSQKRHCATFITLCCEIRLITPLPAVARSSDQILYFLLGHLLHRFVSTQTRKQSFLFVLPPHLHHIQPSVNIHSLPSSMCFSKLNFSFHLLISVCTWRVSERFLL